MADENKELTREKLEAKFKEEFIGGIKAGRRFTFEGEEYIPVRESDNISTVLNHDGNNYSSIGTYDHRADRVYTGGFGLPYIKELDIRYDDFCDRIFDVDEKIQDRVKECLKERLRSDSAFVEADDDHVLFIIKKDLFKNGFMKVEKREGAAIQDYVERMDISFENQVDFLDDPDETIKQITNEIFENAGKKKSIPDFQQIKADSDKCNCLVENGLVDDFAVDIFGQDLEEVRMAHDLTEALKDKATVSVTFSPLFSEKTGKTKIVVDGIKADDSVQTITYDSLSARELSHYFSDYTNRKEWKDTGFFHDGSINRQLPIYEGADGKITVKSDATTRRCIGQIELTIGDIQSISYRKKELYNRDDYPDHITGQDYVKAILAKKEAARENDYLNSVDMGEFNEKFMDEYGRIYDAEELGEEVAGYKDALNRGDFIIEKNEEFMKKFCEYRGDLVSSDRETAALGFTVDAFLSKFKAQERETANVKTEAKTEQKTEQKKKYRGR